MSVTQVWISYMLRVAEQQVSPLLTTPGSMNSAMITLVYPQVATPKLARNWPFYGSNKYPEPLDGYPQVGNCYFWGSPGLPLVSSTVNRRFGLGHLQGASWCKLKKTWWSQHDGWNELVSVNCEWNRSNIIGVCVYVHMLHCNNQYHTNFWITIASDIT